MQAYIYQGDMLCVVCGVGQRVLLDQQGKTPPNPDDWFSYNSTEYPKGPFDESHFKPNDDAEEGFKSPMFCGHCGAFLENKLTAEGLARLQVAIFDQSMAPSQIASLRSFYNLDEGMNHEPNLE